MASINRFNRHRIIQQQNDKFFNRLINTSPTLSRTSWIKDNKENEKYKLNISRSKCNLIITQIQPRTIRNK